MKNKAPDRSIQSTRGKTSEPATNATLLDGRVGVIIILTVVIVCTLIVSVLVGGRLWKIGVVDEWQWEYFENPIHLIVAGPAILFAVLLVAIVGIALRNRFAKPRHELLVVALCLLMSLGVVMGFGEAGPAGKYDAAPIMASPWISGYYGEAVRVTDVRDYLDNYAERMMQLKVNDPYGHLADHPVAPIMFHWIVNRFMEKSPRFASWFMPPGGDTLETWRRVVESPAAVGMRVSDGQFAGIWASAFFLRLGYWLALIPVYLLGRWLHSREAGLLALAFTSLIPSLHVFSPYIDLFFPLFAVCGFFAWVRAIQSRSILWAAVSALFVVMGMLWTLAFLAIIALLGLATVIAIWRELVQPLGHERVGSQQVEIASSFRERLADFDWPGWVLLGGTWAAAFLVSTLLPTLLFGYDVWEVWWNCLSQHADFAVLFPRSHVAWVLFNPVEFALFTSVPVCLLMLLAAVKDACLWFRHPRDTALSILPWALLGVLAALNFSGKNLGEVARLWMFLMPFAAVSAATSLAEMDGRRGWLAAGVLLLAGVQLVAFRMTLDGLGIL